MKSRSRFLTQPRRLAISAGLLLFGLLIGQAQPATSVRASGLDRASAAQPNLFDLHDAANHTQITYSTSGMDGRPHLNYTDPRLHHSFSGKEIRVVPSEIGTQVSVTLEQVPDLHTITLTLLVPAINMRTAHATLSTNAIFTTQHTSIGGPALVKGVLQTYQVLTLQGTARVVVF
jgi:hypothetical protein